MITSYLSIRFTVALQWLQRADIYRSLILRIERDTVCGPALANNRICNRQIAQQGYVRVPGVWCHTSGAY
jgi:hypothetical protein